MARRETIYAATFIEKEVERDDYNEGLGGDRTCTLSKTISVTAETLAELFEKLSEAYCLDIDDLFIPADDDEEITWVGYNRLEDADGNEPDEGDMERFRAGDLELWLADYSFGIEKRTVEPVTLDELKGSGLETH